MQNKFRTIIEALNKMDLPDTKIQWAGSTVLLWQPGRLGFADPLTQFKADENVLDNIVKWLNVNDRKCTQIVDGRVRL